MNGFHFAHSLTRLARLPGPRRMARSTAWVALGLVVIGLGWLISPGAAAPANSPAPGRPRSPTRLPGTGCSRPCPSTCRKRPRHARLTCLNPRQPCPSRPPSSAAPWRRPRRRADRGGAGAVWAGDRTAGSGGDTISAFASSHRRNVCLAALGASHWWDSYAWVFAAAGEQDARAADFRTVHKSHAHAREFTAPNPGHLAQDARAAPVAASAPARLPPAQPMRSEAMEKIAAQSDQQIRHGFELANRGAYFAARAEFTAALRLIAQGLDNQQNTTFHSQALSAALTAMKEAQDFIPASGKLEGELDLPPIVASHRTPVLKNVPPEQLQAMRALKQYFTFAQEQLALAAGQEVSGSMALGAWARCTPRWPASRIRRSLPPRQRRWSSSRRPSWSAREITSRPTTWAFCWPATAMPRGPAAVGTQRADLPLLGEPQQLECRLPPGWPAASGGSCRGEVPRGSSGGNCPAEERQPLGRRPGRVG